MIECNVNKISITEVTNNNQLLEEAFKGIESFILGVHIFSIFHFITENRKS